MDVIDYRGLKAVVMLVSEAAAAAPDPELVAAIVRQTVAAMQRGEEPLPAASSYSCRILGGLVSKSGIRGALLQQCGDNGLHRISASLESMRVHACLSAHIVFGSVAVNTTARSRYHGKH